MLVVIPTPIGNLEDITLRALEELRKADKIYCEDTRVTSRLLNHYKISKPLTPFHAHNEHKQLASLKSDLVSGLRVVLVSDAGTPAISDPGYIAVKTCIEQNITITCLPGPTAFIPALVASGIPCDKFHFEGFLPHKKGRQTRLEYLSSLNVSFVLYESPHRLVKCLQQLVLHCGQERKACVAREISKVYEEFQRGTLEELHAEFNSRVAIKGEIVVVVSKP